MAEKLGLIALIIAIVTLIILIIVTIIANTHRTSILDNGITLKVQEGKQGDNITTDTMATGGNNIYIGNATNPLTLSIAPDDANIEGTVIYIYNNTGAAANDITIVPSPPVSLNTTQLGATIPQGGFAHLVATNTNSFLRIQ